MLKNKQLNGGYLDCLPFEIHKCFTMNNMQVQKQLKSFSLSSERLISSSHIHTHSSTMLEMAWKYSIPKHNFSQTWLRKASAIFLRVKLAAAFADSS